jgi:ABC-2 type transport system ATP-binding protein
VEASEGKSGALAARIPPEKVPDVLRALVGAGVDVHAIERPEPSLEEIFLEITGGETV